MTEEQRKTLRDYLLEGGAKGKSFLDPKKENGNYIVLDIQNFQREESKKSRSSKNLLIKYENNKETFVSIYSHLNDLEVSAELIAGKFYELALEDRVVFYDGKKLIDSFKNELDPAKTKSLILIKDEKNYLDSLKQKIEYLKKDSGELENRYKFMESCLEGKLGSYQGNGLNNADTALADEGILGEKEKEFSLDSSGGSGLLDLSLEEDTSSEGLLDEIEKKEYSLNGDVQLTEEDTNLDSFGSGSGLLDLSLQADDTSLGGLLDEVYTGENSKTPKPPEHEEREYDLSEDTRLNAPAPEDTGADINLDSFGSGSGLLDLSLQADDTSLGGLLDEVYIKECPQPAGETEIPLEQKLSEPENKPEKRKKKRGFLKTLRRIFWD